jgi:electron transfer flavoprotein alpha subunit
MVLGLIEHDRGALDETSFEMLTLARRLANDLGVTLEAVLVGDEARALAEELPAYGVSKVHLIRHDRLDAYAPEAWAGSVAQLIDEVGAVVVMAPGTDRGNEVVAHIAARKDLPMAANCIQVSPGDPYQITRLRWGGSLLEEASLEGELKLLTVAPHMVPAERAPHAEALVLEEFTPSLEEADFRVRVRDLETSTGDGVSLTDARVVIGGGRGVGSAEGFGVLEELADVLGGAVGGSRVATNNGWRPHSDQIGQTGARIAPDLYIACGISGAIQHMVGCKGAKQILAINTDSEAPMVSKADYAVIGDLHEIVPALSSEIRKLKESK